MIEKAATFKGLTHARMAAPIMSIPSECQLFLILFSDMGGGNPLPDSQISGSIPLVYLRPRQSVLAKTLHLEEQPYIRASNWLGM